VDRFRIPDKDLMWIAHPHNIDKWVRGSGALVIGSPGTNEYNFSHNRRMKEGKANRGSSKQVDKYESLSG
jgi:hypothetical protein